MIPEVLSALRCPHCGESLADCDGALRCRSGHSYDLARSGYVNLLAGAAPAAADTTEMLASRAAFLDTGHYRPIADALAQAAAGAYDARCASTLVVDVGCGTGYYLSAMLDRSPGRFGLGLDISKHAAARCARAHPRAGAAVCDAWARLPLADGSVAVLSSVFAPRNPAEFARVLAPGGRVIVVSAAAEHLTELIGPLELMSVDPEKDARIEAGFSEVFELESVEPLCFAVQLSREDTRALVLMGPSAHHSDAIRLEAALSGLEEPVIVTAAVTIRVFASRG